MTETAVSFTVEMPIAPRRGIRARAGAPSSEAALPPRPVEPGRVPRISRLMALAIRMRRLVDEGAVRDYSDLARLGGVSIPRMTQIMSLLLLAPDIQEEILDLPRVTEGRDPIRERAVRAIAAGPFWGAQRERWHRLSTTGGMASGSSQELRRPTRQVESRMTDPRLVRSARSRPRKGRITK